MFEKALDDISSSAPDFKLNWSALRNEGAGSFSGCTVEALVLAVALFY